ncbi:MAG: protein kinase family protein [Alphaproteobacteria bacterium]|nr:protein kinase family protein [Alphaproteobacteria bacterium]
MSPVIQKRIHRYDTIKKHLESLSDRELETILSAGASAQTGMGGTSVIIEIEGVPVFVKMVPLNDVEGSPENRKSTKNIFGLPSTYQYGFMSAGFNVWREVASHEKTTKWVLKGENTNFPLMYHHRILPRNNSLLNEQDLAEKIHFWKKEKAIEARLRANHAASKNVILFLEYIPHTLIGWLQKQSTQANLDVLDKNIEMIHNNLLSTVAFMNSKGMLHFDTHFNNILTDGEQLYFTDFGLANSLDFTLSEEEMTFFQHHLNYDRCYVMTQLTDWILNYAFGEFSKEKSNAIVYLDNVLRGYASGKRQNPSPKNLTPFLESFLKRYATITLVMDVFFHRFRTKNIKEMPYPFDVLETLWKAAS